MKKLLALGIAILTMTTSVFAGTDVNVKVNDKEIEAKGVIVDGRTLVPVRGIFEELGYFVVYNAETKTAFLNSLGSTIKMTYGNEYFTVNDENITPDVPELYKKKGKYYYWHGVNIVAILVYIISGLIGYFVDFDNSFFIATPIAAIAYFFAAKAFAHKMPVIADETKES